MIGTNGVCSVCHQQVGTAVAHTCAVRPTPVSPGTEAGPPFTMTAECPWCTAPVPDDDPVRPLGERLTHLLDDDHWNNVEPMLKSLRQQLDALRTAKETAERLVKVDDAFHRHTVAQRDAAWREIEQLRAALAASEEKAGKLREIAAEAIETAADCAAMPITEWLKGVRSRLAALDGAE